MAHIICACVLGTSAVLQGIWEYPEERSTMFTNSQDLLMSFTYIYIYINVYIYNINYVSPRRVGRFSGV